MPSYAVRTSYPMIDSIMPRLSAESRLSSATTTRCVAGESGAFRACVGCVGSLVTPSTSESCDRIGSLQRCEVHGFPPAERRVKHGATAASNRSGLHRSGDPGGLLHR